MDVVVVSLILSLIVAGIVYFSIESFERVLEINIMSHVIIFLLTILIALYAFINLSGNYGYEEIIDISFIFAIDLFLIVFSIIEKLYRKFKQN